MSRLVSLSLSRVFVLTDTVGSVGGDSGHGSSQTDAYDELFHLPTTADLEPLDSDQEEASNKVAFDWLGRHCVYLVFLKEVILNPVGKVSPLFHTGACVCSSEVQLCVCMSLHGTIE